MQGKCVAPPDAEIASAIADLELNAPEPWHAPRCILLASEQVFFVDRSRLWIDSLHIQFIEADTTPRGIDIKNYGHAYVTNTVVQGDRKSKASAVFVLAGIGGIYAEGVTPLLHPGAEHRILRKCKRRVCACRPEVAICALLTPGHVDVVVVGMSWGAAGTVALIGCAKPPATSGVASSASETCSDNKQPCSGGCFICSLFADVMLMPAHGCCTVVRSLRILWVFGFVAPANLFPGRTQTQTPNTNKSS